MTTTCPSSCDSGALHRLCLHSALKYTQAARRLGPPTWKVKEEVVANHGTGQAIMLILAYSQLGNELKITLHKDTLLLDPAHSNQLVQLPYGSRSFTVSGPTVWNSLPDCLRDPSLSLDSVTRFLKT